MTVLTSRLAEFDNAIGIFKAFPNAEHLLRLNKAAIPLLTPPSPEPAPWKPIESPDAFAGDFQEIRILADRRLDDHESRQLSGCLGYALREVLAGEDLSEPAVTCLRDSADTTRMTVLEYGYDSTSSRRDDPDHAEAFARAVTYAAEGSPVRTTNRAGAGTKGTRLVNGIALCNLAFYVR